MDWGWGQWGDLASNPIRTKLTGPYWGRLLIRPSRLCKVTKAIKARTKETRAKNPARNCDSTSGVNVSQSVAYVWSLEMHVLTVKTNAGNPPLFLKMAKRRPKKARLAIPAEMAVMIKEPVRATGLPGIRG